MSGKTRKRSLAESLKALNDSAVNAGPAATASYSLIHFCGHPWPAEVLVAPGGERILRRRGLLEEACGLGYTDPKD